MVRTLSIDKNGLRKGAWNKEEDIKLKAFIQRYGHYNWRQLPKNAGLLRTGKSCRLRWVNYLKPGLNRGNFSKAEEKLVIKLHEAFGNKWSAIAAKLPGRTDNCIKNFWHGHLKKRLDKEKRSKNADNSQSTTSGLYDQVDHQEKLDSITSTVSHEPTKPSNSGLLQTSSNSIDELTLTSNSIVNEKQNVDSMELLPEFSSFWSEPFVLDTCDYDEQINSYPSSEEQFFDLITTYVENQDLYCSFIP